MNTIKSLPSGKYVPHWRSSNHALRKRGSLTVYLGSDLERKSGQPLARGERGRPLVNSAAVITLGVGFPEGVSAAAAGGAVGLLRSVIDLAGLTTLPVPDPSRVLPPAGKGAAARLAQVRRLPRG